MHAQTNLITRTHLPDADYDWAYTAHGDIEEDIPTDIPEPLGQTVTLATHVDANLHHDEITGRAVAGMLHFVNQMPFDWHSKKQATVETATHGSKFVGARIAADQDRNSFRHLGVPICGKTHMFGDNESTVDSSAKPEAKLHKRHTALSFHRVREAIAAGVLSFHWIPGSINPADILSKHWGCQAAWPLLKPMLFWCDGDTIKLLDEKDAKTKKDVVKGNSH